MTDIGMNLTGVTYWSTSEPFIDRFKTSGAWKSNITGTTVTVDAHGDPLGIPAGASNISTNFAVDPLSAGTDNQYVLTFDGTASIRLNGVKIISSDPGKIVFQVINANSTYVGMSVTSMSTTDPLHDIHVVRADQVDLFNSGEIFNPAFIDKVSHWDTLRFMGWENTNTLSQVNWDSHSTITDATWNTGASPDGVPIEVMVKLANEAHTDMWYNVPTTADDTYVTNALAYIRDNLDPSLKVHVEYSNEVWNWSYDAATYAQAQANALWGTDANHDGVIDNTNPAEKVQGGSMVYYGYRSAQVAHIAHEVFSGEAGDRLDTVLATQAVNPALTTYYIIPGIAKADAGSPGDLFTEYAIAPYFGGELSRPGTAADKATILAWAHSGQAGIDAAFHELEYGGSLSTDQSLASFAAVYAAQGAIAHQYGMDLVAYEAGASLTTTAYTGQDRIDVSAFFGQLLNDPRAGELYTKMVADFAQAGGTLLTAMNDTGANSTFGYWGVLDTIYDTSSPRYDALVAAAADAHETGSGGGLGTDAPVVDPTASLINGTAGDDTLTGTDGDDILNGAAGADHMIGGAGNDVYTVDNAGDTIVENIGGGIDTVTTSLDHYTLGDNLENLTFVGTDHIVGTGNKLDNVITAGSGDAMLSGLAGNDTLIGGAGNDTLDGGVGSDSLAGGQGNDTYIVDNAGDHVVEAANGGTDTVITTLDAYTLTDNVENLTHSGSRAFAGTGNALDNVITSGDGRGTLLGLDGNDTLIGSAGADYLDGGAGSDSMSGGGSNDVYIVDSIGDTVTEAVNAGIDEIRTTLGSFTLGANVERLTAIGTGAFTGTGNALDNVLTAGDGPAHLYGLAGNDTLNGGNGDDYLDGGSGIDRMIGGAGNDTYIVDDARDQIIENANGGTDEVRTALAHYTLPNNVENLTYTGTDSFYGAGNRQDNLIVGGNYGNTIYSNGGEDTMIGGDGSDMLSGGHLMIGGKGDDSYYVYDTAAQIVENSGEGHDIVYAMANYTLPDNIEILRLGGNTAIDGTGNALDNLLQGNASANRLDGGAGNDTILAGDGNDTLLGGAGSDILSGAGGDDVLNGGGGKDTLTGGTGADHFVFNPGDLTADPATTTSIQDFSHAEGDRIDLSAIDAVAGTPANEAFTFLGTAAFTGHAGELRVESVGNHWLVAGDTNGDGVADIALNVGVHSGALVASDFLL